MSRSIILLALAVAFAVSAVSADKYCLRQSGDQYAVEARDCTPLETDLVEANYNKTYNTSGWDEISISPLQLKDMNTAYYLAGYLEGYLTWDRIWATYVNTVSGAGLLQSWPVLQWIEAHRNYIVGTVAATASDPFSSRVAMLMQQMEGLSAGYNTAQPDTNKWLNSTQFFWLSFQAEFMDIIALVQGPDYSPPTLKAQSAASHCSALIKDTGADLFMAHDTWSAYASMLRQFKVYNFDTTVALSGYPGVIHSIDDWYMTSNRLTVQETTNEVYNVSLTYDYVLTTTVSEFLRVMTANYLATSGSEWVTYANTQNSGTYCNQWMVVDQKLFVPNEPNPMTRIPDGTFWVYEQAPGPFSQSADMSGHLRTYGYWASYNAWYFPSLQAISGQNVEVAQYGSFFSYTNYSRAKIFRARQGAIQNLTGMHDMMRYNNFRHDPFSLIPNCKGANAGSWNESNKCTPPYSAMLTIASRGDLEPSGNNSLTMGPLAVLGFVGNQQPFGAIDSKITSHLMTLDAKNLRGSIICGPTQSHGLPAFAWEDYTDIPVFNYTWHLMHTPEFNFPWLDVTASPAVIRHPSNDNQGTAIAVVIVLSILLVGIFAVLFIRLHVFKIGAPVDEVSPLTSA